MHSPSHFEVAKLTTTPVVRTCLTRPKGWAVVSAIEVRSYLASYSDISSGCPAFRPFHIKPSQPTLHFRLFPSAATGGCQRGATAECCSASRPCKRCVRVTWSRCDSIYSKPTHLRVHRSCLRAQGPRTKRLSQDRHLRLRPLASPSRFHRCRIRPLNALRRLHICQKRKTRSPHLCYEHQLTPNALIFLVVKRHS